MLLSTSFPQESCLESIREDLRHYYRFLAAQPDADRLRNTNVLSSLQGLMQVMFLSIYLFFYAFLWDDYVKQIIYFSQKCFAWNFEELEGEKVTDALYSYFYIFQIKTPDNSPFFYLSF